MFVTVLRGKSCLKQGVLASCHSRGGWWGGGRSTPVGATEGVGPREVGLARQVNCLLHENC